MVILGGTIFVIRDVGWKMSRCCSDYTFYVSSLLGPLCECMAVSFVYLWLYYSSTIAISKKGKKFDM